jgi:hypothetical protein
LVPIPGTKLAYQFYGLNFRGGDIVGFDTLGTGIAIMDDQGKVVRPEVSPGTTHPTLTWQGTEIGYGSRWLVENGDLFAIGCKGVFVTSECGIARHKRYIGCKQRLKVAVNDRLGIEHK